MSIRRSITFAGTAAAVPLIALGVAACGGNGTAATPSTSSTTTSPTTGGPPATVGVASSSNLGSILVDSQGRTLYLFGKDSGTTSACTGACATAWPPLMASGTATVGGGANAGLVGTTTRADNTQQVTFNGHPLYLFVRDTKPGDTNGQGVNAFGGIWDAVSTSGNPATTQSSGSGGSTSPGGSGSGY